jgi:ABC-type amino acid transport system permease subunit
VVMLLGYYIVPAFGSSSNAYVAVAVSQIVYVGAFAAEIMRSAIASVPPGQIAAARSLGMRRLRMLRAVVLPQAARIAIPPLLNNALTAVKQTSYVSIVGVWELTYAAREVVERTLASFQIFLGVMAIYFLICYPLSLLARWSERRSLIAH